MNVLKSIGGVLLGISVFVGIIAAGVLFFSLGAKVAFAIAPFINWLAGILLLINVLLLILAIFPKIRGVAGIIIYVSSYVYGLSAWIFGLAVTLALWGWLAVVIGIILGGIGVVPIGLLAAIFHGEWGIFWTLLFTVVLTYGSRTIGSVLVDSADNTTTDNNVIDIEPEETYENRSQISNLKAPAEMGTSRDWSDLE
jgi:hypothetical protein